MDFALNSIIGKRENQEDYGVIKTDPSTDGLLAVISDGMGGQVAGEIASLTTVSCFVESFTADGSKNVPLRLRVALEKANQSLAIKVSENSKLQGMGATLIAAHVNSNGLHWTSVGDSILFLYRNKKLIRLNEDHSMSPVLQESVRNGQISEAEARVHPHRNALRSAMTGGNIELIDLTDEVYSLADGDILLLATDGLLTLSESEVCSLLGLHYKQQASVIVERLLQAVTVANKPKQDNTLVQVIKVSGVKGNKLKVFGIVAFALILIASAAALSLSLDFAKAFFSSSITSVDKGNQKPLEAQVKIEPSPIPGLERADEPKLKVATDPSSEQVQQSSESKLANAANSPSAIKAESKVKNEKQLVPPAKILKHKNITIEGAVVKVTPIDPDLPAAKQDINQTKSDSADTSKIGGSSNAKPVNATNENEKTVEVVSFPAGQRMVEKASPAKTADPLSVEDNLKKIPVEDRSIQKKTE